MRPFCTSWPWCSPSSWIGWQPGAEIEVPQGRLWSWDLHGVTGSRISEPMADPKYGSARTPGCDSASVESIFTPRRALTTFGAVDAGRFRAPKEGFEVSARAGGPYLGHPDGRASRTRSAGSPSWASRWSSWCYEYLGELSHSPQKHVAMLTSMLALLPFPVPGCWMPPENCRRLLSRWWGNPKSALADWFGPGKESRPPHVEADLPEATEKY